MLGIKNVVFRRDKGHIFMECPFLVVEGKVQLIMHRIINSVRPWRQSKEGQTCDPGTHGAWTSVEEGQVCVGNMYVSPWKTEGGPRDRIVC